MINQTKETPSDGIMGMIDEAGLRLAGTVPEDDTVYNYDYEGQPTIEMPMDNPAVQASFAIFDKLLTPA